MNEKERIIELVRQNIITMDEALRLLEAGGQTATPTDIQTEETTATEESPESSEEQSDANTSKGEAIIRETVESVRQFVNQGINWLAKELSDDQPEATTTEEVATELEQAAEAEEVTANEETEKQDAAQIAEEANRLSAEYDTLKKNKDNKNEALTVARQRLRELEILAELDELSDDLSSQQQQLQMKIAELEESIQTLNEQLADVKAQQSTLFKSQVKQYKEEFKDFVHKTSENASQFSSQATSSGRKLGDIISKGVKSIMDNISTKEIVVNIPWVKSNTVRRTHTFDGTSVSVLDFKLMNGDLEIHTHLEDEIIIETEMTIFGKGNSEVEQSEEYGTILVDGDRLIFHVDKAFLSHVKVSLPAKMYDHVKIVSTNSDMEFDDLEVKDLYVEVKNGDVDIRRVQAVMLEMTLLNGDVEIEESPIRDLVVKNLNGDFRMVGEVGNVLIDAVNSDVYITKTDVTPSSMTFQLSTGDVKIAIPQQTNLDATCNVSLGDIQYRLTNVNLDSQGKIQRIVSSDAPQVTLNATLSTGDVYLKDN